MLAPNGPMVRIPHRRERVEPRGEPLQDRIENAETSRRHAGSGGSALGSQPLIGEQRRYRLRERGSAAHGFGGARGCQRSRHCGAIAHIRAVQHGAAEPGRLERVVPAFGGQRAADEGDPGEAVEQPELAHGVREIDLRVASDRIAMSASGDAQPLLCQHGADCVAARRMTGNDDRQQAGMVRGEIAMYPRGDLLLAGMRAGSQPQRTRTDLVAQVRQFGAVERQCGSGGLEIADGRPLAGRPASEIARLAAGPGRGTGRTRSVSVLISPGQCRQRLYERAESRALTSTIGMFRASAAKTRLGHNSDSTQSARSGRQQSRKRAVQLGRSAGTNWWRACAGSRLSSRRAEVTVPVVTRISRSGRVSSRCSISPSTAVASPTLAACIQTSGPSGRVALGMPRRSRKRIGCSLPRLRRCAKYSIAIGASGRVTAL